MKNQTQRITVNQSGGFTLVEVLIALMIFGWLSLGAYQILDQIIFAQDKQREMSERLSNMQRLSWQLSQDFRHMVKRSVTDNEGRKRDAFLLDNNNYVVEFTRTGWSNPLQWQRSELQRVAYRIDLHPDVNEPDSEFYGDEKLYLLRHYWSVLDRVESSKPNEQVLAGGVVDLELRYYDGATESWVSAPPEPPSDSTYSEYYVPSKIEISLLFEDEQLLSHAYNLR